MSEPMEIDFGHAAIALGGLKAALAKLESGQAKAVASAEKNLDLLQDGCRRVAASWSGSAWGYHHNLYYGDFDAPGPGHAFDPEWGLIHGIPDGWDARTPDEVERAISQGYAGPSLGDIEATVRAMALSVDVFREGLLAELGWVINDDRTREEARNLREVEGMDLDVSPSDYLPGFMALPRMMRDTSAFSQGARVPAHSHFQARLVACLATERNCVKVAKLSKRLLRQVEINLSIQARPDAAGALPRLQRMCSRFHAVARQMRTRHDSRPTLDINDEYDVQDLLHALLKIEFDDVRAEEWTPSYAGSSSRMDFVLKRERTVIEVKKTRAGLSDKQVGEQLTLDVAKYRRSADCQTLVCFVYDPEGRIGNPHGLAADLGMLSTAEMPVVVFIHPTS